MEIKTREIWWDLDGTLINSFGIYSTILGNVLPEFGIEIPETEILRSHFFGHLNDSIQGACKVDDKVAQQIASRFHEVQEPFYENPEKLFFTDALDLVRRAEAANKRQLVVTNRHHIDNSNASPRAVIANSSLRDSFYDIVSGDYGGYRKPDPRAVARIFDSYGVSPEDITFIGDQFVDAQLAINIGAKALLIARSNDVPNLDRLPTGWEERVTIVSNLEDITV